MISLSLRLALLLVVATTTSAHVTFLDVAARAVTCGAAKAVRWYVGATSPTAVADWYVCVSPLLHEWLGSSAIAASRGIAAAAPGDSDHLRWSKAAHEARRRTVPEPDEEEVGAGSEETALEEKATAPPLSPIDVTEVTEEEHQALDEELERKKSDRFRKPRQEIKVKKTKNETIATPGCFPLSPAARSYFHFFLFMRQAEPLTFAWLDDGDMDQVNAEAALNCVMAQVANVSVPDGPTTWITNIFQRRYSVSSLLVLWRGPLYALAVFGWRAAIWALVGACWLNFHAAIQMIVAAATLLVSAAAGYWLWVRSFAIKTEKEQKNATRVWDVDPSLKTLKENATSVARWICSWERLVMVAWPHAAAVLVPFMLLRFFWRRATGGAIVEPPANFSDLSRSFATFAASYTQGQAELRRLVRESAEGVKEIRTLSKEIETKVDEAATIANSALSLLLEQAGVSLAEGDVDTPAAAPPPVETRTVECQTDALSGIPKLETLLRTKLLPKPRENTQVLREAHQVHAGFSKKRTPSS